MIQPEVCVKFTMKRILREPLLHFLLLGAAIFAAYGLVSKGSGGEGGKIVVTQGQLASMLARLHRAPGNGRPRARNGRG